MIFHGFYVTKDDHKVAFELTTGMKEINDTAFLFGMTLAIVRILYPNVRNQI